MVEEEEDFLDTPIDAMEAHRLTASTLRALQGRKKSKKRVSSAFSRRLGEPVAMERQDSQEGLRVTLAEMEKALGLGSRREGQPSRKEEKRLVAPVNAVAVLDMIKDLQDEIKDINEEIDAENDKMSELQDVRQDEDDFDSPVRNAAKVSTKETMKELALQKEDTTMKKVMAQMMLMKQIKKKKAENSKLEEALRKLAERRKIINSALKEQKSILAQREVERQKAVMAEKEEMIRQLRRRDFL